MDTINFNEIATQRSRLVLELAKNIQTLRRTAFEIKSNGISQQALDNIHTLEIEEQQLLEMVKNTFILQ